MSFSTFQKLQHKKQRSEKIATISLSTAPIARIAAPFVDMILVGDSLAMTIFGLTSTRTIDLTTMIRHARAVTSACSEVPVVIDMPYNSYPDAQQALTNSRLVLEQTGAHGVKLEGGVEIRNTVKCLADEGIPVCGHIGLLPQSVAEGEPYTRKGSEDDAAANLHADAIALQQAGAFAIVIEAILEPIAADISKVLTIPTIGIGASPHCDGQILVAEDIIGLSGSERVPRFVKQYAQVNANIASAIEEYADEVRNLKFPTFEHCYLDKKHKK